VYLINSLKKETNILDSKIDDKDLACSSFIDFSSPKFINIDGIYYGAILVINYSRSMERLFLNKILTLDIDVQLSMFYEKQNTTDVIKEITYSIGNAGANIKESNENAQDIEIMGNVYNDARTIRRALQVEDENLYNLSLYVGTYANSQSILESNLQKIESVLISSGLTVIRANFRQEQSFRATLPFLENDKDISKMISRNVLTSGLVSTYPFVSNELFDKNGVLVGTNSFDKSIVMLDRFDTKKYKNANMFVLGTSGSGKSYFVKLMINRNRFLDINQFVIDPDREYKSLCTSLNGIYINFGINQSINIFDIREYELEDGESYLMNKISKLNTFFSLIFTDMSDEDKSLLEEKIIEVYLKKGITKDNNTLYIENENSLLRKKEFIKSINMPKMQDLYDLLKKDKKLKKYATILKPYVLGSLKYLNEYTNFDINNKLVVVDVNEINEKDMPIVMFVVTEYFWDIIKKDRSKKKILYLDEVWKMINKNEQTADFVFKLFKTIRKYGGAATAITQDVSDFFMLEDGKYGKGILNNSNIKCMFQLEETDIKHLENIINLSDEEKIQLINMKRGTALIHAGRNTLVCNIVSSEKEHSFITSEFINAN